ncbi:unnamed protein product [Heterobilharzia americana]|nr:unnamed protein product [Heterobilharzia americana]
MNSNTLTSTGNHPCILVSTSTATATNNSPITVSPTTNSTVLAKLTDRATYFAVVSDTCAFNRDLCKTRCSRLPFLDLATQISQRPAPWLYHTNREYSRETLSKDPHVFLRYPRYRWHLDPQSPHKKRKAANQRLWYTLQNSLKALGIPPDLVPVVTRRAYSIAGLTIPSSLANYLDVLNPRVSSISYAAANNNNCNTLNTSTGSANRFQHSSSFGTIVNVNSNSIPRKVFVIIIMENIRMIRR